MPSIAVDTGPLIALFNRGDRHHSRAVHFFTSPTGPLVTNLAVLTETCHMLDFARGAVIDFLSWVADAIEIENGTTQDLPRILAIIDKYADLPADFADASLLAMCERLGLDSIATLDRDFDVYRLADGRPLTNVLAPA